MGWNLNDLTAQTGAPLAIFSPSGYMFADEGTQHVVYQGRLGDGSGDGHIHELWWQNEWHHSDLTDKTGAPLVSGEPSGYAFESQKTQHVVYQGFVAGQGNDGHIHELWRDDDWHHNDLTLASQPHAPPVINNPAGYAFSGLQTQDVVYEGANSHIQHLWWSGGWHADDLTATTNAVVLAALPPTAYGFTSQETRHVLYLGTDGHVHELWRDSSGWHYNDLTGPAGAPLASDQPTGFAFDAGSTQLVHYRGTDGHIHQLWGNSAGPVWHPLDLTGTVGGPAASPSRPTGYVFPFDGTLHVDYLGTDGHIHEYWRDSSGWHHNDLTARTGAPLAISNPSGYAFEKQNTQHVVFTADNHHIIELFWVPS